VQPNNYRQMVYIYLQYLDWRLLVGVGWWRIMKGGEKGRKVSVVYNFCFVFYVPCPYSILFFYIHLFVEVNDFILSVIFIFLFNPSLIISWAATSIYPSFSFSCDWYEPHIIMRVTVLYCALIALASAFCVGWWVY